MFSLVYVTATFSLSLAKAQIILIKQFTRCNQWCSQGLSEVAHPEVQNEEEKEKRLSKNKKNGSKFEARMRKVEVLHTRDIEAGYGPGYDSERKLRCRTIL